MEIIKSRDDEDSSPLANVQAIQKRLIRPPHALPTQSSTTTSLFTTGNDIASRNWTELKVSPKIQKREVRNVKTVEDYLDSNLLSEIRSKIGAKRIRTAGRGYQNKMMMKLEREEEDSKKKKVFDDRQKFDWPVDELKVFDGVEEGLRSEKLQRNEAVNLNDAHDFIGKNEDEDEEERVSSYSPFQRFETTALKRFLG